MPTYDYRCDACGHTFEAFQSIKESSKRKCPACGKLKLQRLIGGGAGLIFKGSGFYLTDYRSDSYKKGAEADKPASAKPESGSSEGSAKKDAKDTPKSGAKPDGKADGAKSKSDKPADKKRTGGKDAKSA